MGTRWGVEEDQNAMSMALRPAVRFVRKARLIGAGGAVFASTVRSKMECARSLAGRSSNRKATGLAVAFLRIAYRSLFFLLLLAHACYEVGGAIVQGRHGA